MAKKYKWSGEDLNLLKSLYLFFSNKELGRIFGLSERTIHNILGKYGLYRNSLTENQVKRIKNNIPLIILKPLSMFDDDVIRLDEVVVDRLENERS